MTAVDVLVIGSGPCGAIAARELVGLGLRVTTLDAGLRPVRGVIVRAGGTTVVRWADPRSLNRRRHRHGRTGDAATEWTSSLAPGGLSNYWAAAVPRMAPDDFRDGAALDERFRWPISYRDLEPFYQIVERSMAITAGDAFRGVPPNLAPFHRNLKRDWAPVVARVTTGGNGIGLLPMAKGARWMVAMRPTSANSYYCLLKPLLDDPNFRFVAGAFAIRVHGSGARGQASVEFVDRTTGDRSRLQARAVVVAAGTIDSTRILLQSRSNDFPDGLGNSAGLVGRYLHDHPLQWWPAQLERPMPILSHPLYIARQPVGQGQPLMASSLTVGMVGPSARVRSWCGGKSDRIGVQVLGTTVPSDLLSVSLDEGPPASDPANDPIVLSVHYDDAALSNMEQARERFVALFAQAGLGATPQGPFHQIRPGLSSHYGGTIRMHADRAFGVLDEWNRVYDSPNILVCDASCFPTGPEKNPTLTAMAIACRAAHRLAADLKGETSPERSTSR